MLVNNACHLGLGHRFLDMPIEFFDEVLAVNLRGYALCAQYAARQMVARGGGAIVNIGSNTADRALADRAAYIASKGGVESLTRAIAVELAEYKIRVNCVVPGLHLHRALGHASRGDQAAALEKRPLGQGVQPGRHRRGGRVSRLVEGRQHHRLVPAGFGRHRHPVGAAGLRGVSGSGVYREHEP